MLKPLRPRLLLEKRLISHVNDLYLTQDIQAILILKISKNVVVILLIHHLKFIQKLFPYCLSITKDLFIPRPYVTFKHFELIS